MFHVSGGADADGAKPLVGIMVTLTMLLRVGGVDGARLLVQIILRIIPLITS